jgi:hypothetical protein
MNVDHLAGDVRVPSLGPKIVCTKCRRAAELAGEGEAMKRPAKQPSQPASKSSKWDIYHIKGTPAALLGRVEAPDEETAIRKAVDEFGISPALQKKASRAAAVIARIAVRLRRESHPSE